MDLVALWHVALPGPEVELVSSAWAGRFFTTGTVIRASNPSLVLPTGCKQSRQS